MAYLGYHVISIWGQIWSLPFEVGIYMSSLSREIRWCPNYAASLIQVIFRKKSHFRQNRHFHLWLFHRPLESQMLSLLTHELSTRWRYTREVSIVHFGFPIATITPKFGDIFRKIIENGKIDMQWLVMVYAEMSARTAGVFERFFMFCSMLPRSRDRR